MFLRVLADGSARVRKIFNADNAEGLSGVMEQRICTHFQNYFFSSNKILGVSALNICFKLMVNIQENITLAPLTTLEVGGAARYFVEAKVEQDIVDALLFAERRGLPIFVLGGGSNLLVSDKGFEGLVIKIAVRGLETTQDKSDVYVSAAAGEDWDEFVEFCVDRKLAGVECLSGIPGTVGATPVQNVGAYGQEVAETISSVRVLCRQTKERKTLSKEQCGFAYRTSIFNFTAKDKYIVLAVDYCLHLDGAPSLRYADLKNYFVGRNNPTLAEVRQAVLKIRSAKSMVISPEDENRRSAGSFFKNPIVSAEHYAEIQKTARRLNSTEESQSVPSYPVAEGNVKVPAAWLIEKSGFSKGYERGRAGLSTRHTLAIVNKGGASAEEILSLVQEIQTRVNEQFGVQLKPEPVFIG